MDRLRAVLRAQQEERMRCLDLLGVVRPDESIRLPEVLRDQMSSLIGKCVKADARAEQLHASLERVRAQEGALRARVRDLEIETRELQKMELVAVGMARARAQVGAGVVANADRPTPKRGIMRVTELAPSGYVAQVPYGTSRAVPQFSTATMLLLVTYPYNTQLNYSGAPRLIRRSVRLRLLSDFSKIRYCI